MKKLLALVAVMMLAVPAVADDSLLAQLGLSGLQVVSMDQASQVSGRGFVTSHGFVEGEIDFDDGTFYLADIDAFQEIDLEGLENLSGALNALGSLTVDFSEDLDGAYWIFGGAVNVGAATTAIGLADSF